MSTGTRRDDDRWPVRGAAVVGGLASALLVVFVTPVGSPLAVTLLAMVVVGGGTAIAAARRRLPSGAGAVSAGVVAVLLVLGGVSTALQALLAAPETGALAGVFRGGSLLLAGLGLLAGLFAAGVSIFFSRRAQRRLGTGS
jgi:hypothetical protein